MLQLREEQARERGLDPRVQPLRAQIAAEEAARAEERRSNALAAAEAREQLREAQIADRTAADELARQREMFAAGLLARRDLERAEANAQARAANLTRLRAVVERVQQEQRGRERERDVRVQRLRGELAALQAERETARSAVQRLQHDVQRRKIRAPAAGRIAEAAAVRPGMVVTEGERLGSIVAEGPLMVAAQFAPPAARGRIKPGQRAVVRLEALPWTEYGTVTSALDCGPAALKALFGGYGVHLSYGRLREACQTDVDGTSIDALEEVALALGLQVKQRMLPADGLLLPAFDALPAIVMTRLPDGGNHFVVVWQAKGRRVQVMDSAEGRMWLDRAVHSDHRGPRPTSPCRRLRQVARRLRA